MQNAVPPTPPIVAFRLEPKSMQVALEWRREGHLNCLWKDAETFTGNDMFVSWYAQCGKYYVGGFLQKGEEPAHRTSSLGPRLGRRPVPVIDIFTGALIGADNFGSASLSREASSSLRDATAPRFTVSRISARKRNAGRASRVSNDDDILPSNYRVTRIALEGNYGVSLRGAVVS